ncbi:MAG: MarR family transcriptional regulator [Microlunatus sp.]|nr:MarR family transcriptional regulator [Microlunatus sp.]
MDLDVSARLRGVVMRLSRQLNASATHVGLTPSQASALGLISHRGPLSLSELAAIEGLNPTMVSRIVGRLDELGLISRRQNPQDLRSAVVEVTEAGRQASERVRGERGKVLSACFEQLERSEQDAVVTALPALEALAEKLINSSGGNPSVPTGSSEGNNR